jgi:heme/copper-type cytochrome/quinol oxidase subunit 3
MVFDDQLDLAAINAALLIMSSSTANCTVAEPACQNRAIGPDKSWLGSTVSSLMRLLLGNRQRGRQRPPE